MQTDIVQLLTSMKLNITAVEQGERCAAVLDEIEADCVQLLELMKLFLISERDSYYGYFLMNLTYDVDFSSRSIAGILLDRFPPVFHTNPLLLGKFTLKEILFIVCHEIDHIVLNHPAEMVKSNPERDPDTFERFNLAADASVNDRILKEIRDEHRSFLSAPEGHISSAVLKKMFKLRSVRPLESYLYYFQLIQNKPLPERAPQLCWQAILKKYVGTIAAGKHKTRTRLNRRQPERFDLSGQQDEKVLKIVVAIDTSGSVSDRDVAFILNEIVAIIAGRKHSLTVIECDSEVQRVYSVKTQVDIKKNVVGRGGTAFTPVIEYVNNDRYFRDALLIYFTDGYGEREIPRPKTYRNLWVILGNPKNLSVREPYGAVVAFGKE